MVEGVAETLNLPESKELKWVSVEDFPTYPFAKPQQKCGKTLSRKKKSKKLTLEHIII